MTWQQKPVEKKEGHYLLRTTLNESNEATQWAIYNAIRKYRKFIPLIEK